MTADQVGTWNCELLDEVYSYVCRTLFEALAGRRAYGGVVRSTRGHPEPITALEQI
jgi:hypothetical protein